MARWRRPIGVLLSCVVFGLLLGVGLRGNPTGDIPDADLRNGRVFIQDNLWSTATHEYAVWVAPDDTPYAARRASTGGRWQIENLSRVPGNPLGAPTGRDEHNVYAVGVDAEGGVHIAGNTTVGPLRYVRASASLNGWSPRPAPVVGPSATYPAFTALPNDTLLFWHQQGVVLRDGAIVLNALGSGASSWRSMGSILDGTGSGEVPYINHVVIDPESGAIHLMFQWRDGAEVETTTDVGYARSTDGGRTWETIDGTRLPLPISHGRASTVLDTPATGSGLVNQGGLTVDAQGRPHGILLFDPRPGDRAWLHLWADEESWHREWLTDLDLEGRPQLAGTPDGRVWLLGVSGSTVEAIDITPGGEGGTRVEVTTVPVGWEVSYDSQALARDGTVRMLIPDGDTPHVVEAPLTGG